MVLVHPVIDISDCNKVGEIERFVLNLTATDLVVFGVLFIYFFRCHHSQYVLGSIIDLFFSFNLVILFFFLRERVQRWVLNYIWLNIMLILVIFILQYGLGYLKIFCTNSGRLGEMVLTKLFFFFFGPP